eukprot:m.129392 g.129392  ORF g.129392 m.129392 type:complete len:416 (+) comp9431_c0_seq2:417-1664(+)
MGIHNPLPTSLRSECQKAAHILSEFTIPNASSGPDSLIPKSIIAVCKGIAILSVFKLGFLVTARGGSGVVLAKTNNNSWSAPSAIALAGIGGGFELGVEMTDFVIILNSDSAVDSFKKGSNVTLGGNMTVAIGPLGRNLEADVAIRSAASFYTYSKSRGLFAGISLEGACIAERKSANRKLYGGEVRARDLLAGAYPQPDEAQTLYTALGIAEGLSNELADRRMSVTARSIGHSAGSAAWGAPAAAPRPAGRKTSEKSGEKSSSESGRSSAKTPVAKSSPSPAAAATSPPEPASAPWTSSRFDKPVFGYASAPAYQPAPFTSKVPAPEHHQGHQFKSHKKEAPAVATYNVNSVDWNSEVKCKALYDFHGEMPCDLKFEEGAVITVLTRTSSQDDWWEGRYKGHVGIFPANYVKLF